MRHAQQNRTNQSTYSGKTSFKVLLSWGLEASERSRLQEQFIDNQIDILCATNAFGMGIDKPDVRGVIHFDLPDSLKITCRKSGELDVMVKKLGAIV